MASISFRGDFEDYDLLNNLFEMKGGNIMPIDEVKVKEIIESVFTFDYVGNAMIGVRRDPKSEVAQQELLKQLIESAKSEAGDTSPETIEIIVKAAQERVKQYAKGSSAAQSGCGGLG